MPPRRRPGVPLGGLHIPVPVIPGRTPGGTGGRPPGPGGRPPSEPPGPPRWVAPGSMGDAEKEIGKCEDIDTNLTLRKGKVLNAIYDLGLFKEKGYDDFEDWLAAEGPWSVGYSTKVMVFARWFDDERLANKAGITRGSELIRWCEYTQEDPRVIVAQDGMVAGRPYSKHTRRSLAEAITALIERAEKESLDEMAEEAAEDWSTPAFSRPAIEPLAPEVVRVAKRNLRGFVKHARDEGVDYVDAEVVKFEGEAWARLRIRASELPRFYDG